MSKAADIIATAVQQGRDLRFWHDAKRVTISPYLYGLSSSGDEIVVGVTPAGVCLSFKRPEMIGIEIVPRSGHPPCTWNADDVAQTLVAAPRAS